MIDGRYDRNHLFFLIIKYVICKRSSEQKTHRKIDDILMIISTLLIFIFYQIIDRNHSCRVM